MKLSYAIKYVEDMDRAIAFHRDVLGLELRLTFTQPPTEMHGMHIARLKDIDGAETSVSGPV